MTAVSLEAAIGDDPGRFASGRQFAAWLGLTPRVSASGERRQLARITKRGSARLRSLLVVCAQAMLRQYRQGRHGDPLACWARHLLARKRWNVAVVALANKLARIVWKVASSGARLSGAHRIGSQTRLATHGSKLMTSASSLAAQWPQVSSGPSGRQDDQARAAWQIFIMGRPGRIHVCRTTPSA
jgi:hypothetical protein